MQKKRRYSRKTGLILLLFMVVLCSVIFFAIRNLKSQMKDMQSQIDLLQKWTGAGRTDDPGDRKQNPDQPQSGENTGDESIYASTIPAMQVDKPVKRTREEAIQYLKGWAADNTVIKEICEKSVRYPERLLVALANNPEMADFVAGYPNRKTGKVGELTQEECEESFPLLLQWDPRWGYEEYGKESIIGLSGCGPACMSMMLFYLTGDKELTPDVIAKYSEENGYYVEGTGTAWSLMEEMPGRYGIRVSKPKVLKTDMQSVLDQGGVIICAMGKGDFTAAGHFIVIYGYDREGFFINDPNCVSRSRKKWTYDEIARQIKAIWGYTKGSGSILSMGVRAKK